MFYIHLLDFGFRSVHAIGLSVNSGDASVSAGMYFPSVSITASSYSSSLLRSSSSTESLSVFVSQQAPPVVSLHFLIAVTSGFMHLITVFYVLQRKSN